MHARNAHWTSGVFTLLYADPGGARTRRWQAGRPPQTRRVPRRGGTRPALSAVSSLRACVQAPPRSCRSRAHRSPRRSGAWALLQGAGHRPRGRDVRREQRGPCAGAGPKVADPQLLGIGVLHEPVRGAHKPPREQPDVEPEAGGAEVHLLLVLREEVDQQRREVCLAKHPSDVAISGAVPAAPASVREQHYLSCAVGDAQAPFEGDRPRRDTNLALLHRSRPPFRFGRGAALLPLSPGALEQLDDLLVRHLIEVFVPEADGHEVGGCFQADQLVHLGAEQLGRRLGAHGRGQDEAPRIPPSERLYRRPRGHARGKPVVHQDHDPPLNLGFGPISSQEAQASLYLPRLLPYGTLDVLFGDLQSLHGTFVEYEHPALRDGADAELLTPRRTQLAGDKDVKRRAESP